MHLMKTAEGQSIPKTFWFKLLTPETAPWLFEGERAKGDRQQSKGRWCGVCGGSICSHHSVPWIHSLPAGRFHGALREEPSFALFLCLPPPS